MYRVSILSINMSYSEYIVKTDVHTVASIQNINTKEVVQTDTKQRYLVLNCDVNLLCSDNHTLRKYNAVVLDPSSRAIMSIGPSFSYGVETFQTLYPEIETTDENMMVEEMVEGVAIHLFYDYRIKQWEINTRNSVSGNYSYTRMPGVIAKTFRQMIFEIWNLDMNTQTINDWSGCSYLDTKCCYHFILQHPDNHIVLNHVYPTLYYTGMYELHLEGVKNKMRYISAHWKNVFPPEIQIKIPNVIPFVPQPSFTYTENISVYNALQSNPLKMGIGFLHKYSGDRCFILNDRYKNLQELRGTHPNMMYQYICLRRISKIREFLSHFPQYKSMFWKFHEMYEDLIQQIHQHYYKYYIRKTEKDVPKKLFYHVAQIHHTIFKPSLHTDIKAIIKKAVVRKYVEALEPGCILHLIQNEKYLQDGIVKS